MLRWAMIGGGKGSQIGPAHRIAAGIDGAWRLVAGALDHDAARGIAFAGELGVRGYPDWRALLDGETGEDRPHLVTVATPNNTHHEIALAALNAGFDVLCEKPLTMTVEEAEALVAAADASGRILAVNYGYSGYPLVRHMRAMVERGDLGEVRVVVAEFAHGHHAAGDDAENPRVRWRYDPAQIGPSAQFADCGIHALQMASFVTGQTLERLSADFVSAVSSRTLEDDAMIQGEMSGGARLRLWTSSVALGQQHGLRLRVFGSKGGVEWEQERPDQLRYTPLGGRTQIVERGAGESPEETRASRITVGHAEGMPLAFANVYADLAEAIAAREAGRDADRAAVFPTGQDGLRGVAAIHAAVDSAKADGAWVDARPPSLR